MKFSVPSKWICGYGSYVLVIPPNAKLDEITINTNRCDITCDSLIASKININVNHGDLKVHQLTADNAAISVDGTLDAASSQIAMSGNISADQRLTLGTAGAAKDNTMNNTTIYNKRGGITLYAKLTGNASVQTSRGNLEAVLYGSRTNYTLPAAAANLLIHDSAIQEDNTKDNSTELFGTVGVDVSKGNASISFEQ